MSETSPSEHKGQRLEIKRIAVEPLETESFQRFGNVLEALSSNDPSLNRSPGNMAFLWISRYLVHPSPPFVGVVRYRYRGCRCEFLQKHPASTLVLVPLGSSPSVLIAAQDDARGQPDLLTVRAFLLKGDKGVVISPGTWVRYLYPLMEHAEAVCVSSRVDPADDLVRADLAREFGTILEFSFLAAADLGVQLGVGEVVVGLDPEPGR